MIETIPPKLLGIAIDDLYADGLTKGKLMEYVGWLIGLALVIYGVNYIWMYQLFGGAFLLERSMRSRIKSTLFGPLFFCREMRIDRRTQYGISCN
ncbi:hypothetical protein MX569_12390 [Anoxybacillus kestanbolensis]|uniref:hypothetical protein n=1 Tax=Anoxybacillus kestanbolensis TaxID=227476 RepID=UPI00208DC75B|nr:hypothetical protein [Anoxybacillus kestanbolensis]MCL9971386.1 hypothetical protein [Anoxybacillus kestanbolensis]